jgi:hypothetical protein
MQTFLKMFLSMFGKAGLKALINTLAGSSMFQEFVHGLIMKRLEGLKEKYPALYTTLDGFALALSKIPAVTTDEDPHDVDQIAALFALNQHLDGVEKSLHIFTQKSKEVHLKLSK